MMGHSQCWTQCWLAQRVAVDYVSWAHTLSLAFGAILPHLLDCKSMEGLEAGPLAPLSSPSLGQEGAAYWLMD